jgi:hypothetical protein
MPAEAAVLVSVASPALVLPYMVSLSVEVMSVRRGSMPCLSW